MTFYAIRHRPTGHYMPAGGIRHTKEEPKKGCVPRLFKRRSDATLALTWWVEGVSGIWYRDDDEFIETNKMPHRKAEEMEIVEMTLVECADNKHGSTVWT